jgi:hypothetical protein
VVVALGVGEHRGSMARGSKQGGRLLLFASGLVVNINLVAAREQLQVL